MHFVGEVKDTTNEPENDEPSTAAHAESEPPAAPSPDPDDVPLCQLLASSEILGECVYDLCHGKAALHASSELNYLVTSKGVIKNLVSKSLLFL